VGEGDIALFEHEFEEVHDMPHAQLGLLAFLGQKLELAAWIYGRGVQAEPDNANYWNNFGTALHEKALMSTPTNASMLALATQCLEKAVSLKPDEAVFQSNYGFALLETWRGSHDAATLQAAVVAFKRATTLDPNSATAWAHLGEALAAQGDQAGALAALEKSRALAPFNGALLSTRFRLPQDVQKSFVQAIAGEGKCKVNYSCKEQCPHSIIGQVNYVTCEESQSLAQSACEDGRPYPPYFDCREQVPEFGILFPGLNSGFSLITPWGRLDMTIDGAGAVNYKFKPSTSVGGVGMNFTAQGTWLPRSGFGSVRLRPGLSYNLMGSDAAKAAGDVKMGPASMSFEVKHDMKEKISLKVYGATVLSH
jgi:hypothetical protein